MKFKVFLVIVFIVCFRITLKAQMSIDTIKIDEVRVYGSYPDVHVVGASVLKVDTLKLLTFSNRSLADLLQSNNFNIKTYGVGGLASISTRGGSSYHTAVVWNGINIQSPMNGNVNLSMMPVTMFNSIKFQEGGSGTAYGSGAVSGVLLVNSNGILNTPNKVNVGIMYGGGNTHSVTSGIKLGNRNVAVALKLYGSKADNDYSFKNIFKYGDPKENISNAQAKQYGLLSDASVRFAENTQWNLSGWIQHNNKNLQTIMSSTNPSQANQTDDNYAASSNFKFSFGNVAFKLKNALLDGKIDYSDPTTNNFSISEFTQFINEIEAKVAALKGGEVDINLNYTRETANADDYTSGNALRNKLSAYASLSKSFFNRKVLLSTVLRSDMIDGDFKPTTYSLGTEYSVLSFLKLKASAARVFRFPTLNDLFWANTTYAAGNPDLKSELGWNTDCGAVFHYSTNLVSVEVANTIYYTNIKDWISWISDPTDSWKYKPVNLSTGESYGDELSSSFKYHVGKFNVGVGVMYNYTHSRMYGDDDYDGQTMFYMPKHRLNGNLTLVYGSWQALFDYSYTGLRYTDAQHSLPYYNVGNLSVGKNFSISGVRTTVLFTVNNLWNENYQLIRSYAMPLRYYQISVNMELSKL